MKLCFSPLGWHSGGLFCQEVLHHKAGFIKNNSAQRGVRNFEIKVFVVLCYLCEIGPAIPTPLEYLPPNLKSFDLILGLVTRETWW